MESHAITVPRTARYFTLGTPSPQIRYFWLVCHGYGQLAGQFIRKFESILDDTTFVLAPEGLSRFYWQGVSGDVGASWMTKEDRLSEIEDYANYLSALYERYTSQLPSDVKIILMGFSQGCATQIRWMANRLPHFHHLLLWAGALPEDIDYHPHHGYFEGKNIDFFYGANDSYLTPERIEAHRQIIVQSGLKVQMHTFDGQHEVDREALREWFLRLKG